jgi:hypothetical protein
MVLALRSSGADDKVLGMYRPKFNRFAVTVLGFALGLGFAIFGYVVAKMTILKPAAHNSEEFMRVTSPDGKLDAVLTTDSSGGAPGGIFWFLYVVPKGRPAPYDETKKLFFADALTKGSVVWNKPHLIEIHYDKASIMHFRNISTTSDNGIAYVELRLVPSSEYSLMTPDGGWRPDN